MGAVTTYRIIQLQVENLKRIVAVSITPEGNLVQITGRNGAGKSSVLDAIWWALAGAEHIQAAPIRQGAQSARIRLDLGELVVERRFGAKGSSLRVTNREGATYPSPQAMLDALVGALSFDPLEFMRMKPREQFDALRRVAAVNFDFEAHDRDRAEAYRRRTEVNRRVADLKSQAAGIHVPMDTPTEPVDEAPIIDALATIGQANQSAAVYDANIETKRVHVETCWELLEDLRERANAAEIAHEDAENALDEAKAQLRPEVPDSEALRSALLRAKETNRQVEMARKRVEIERAATQATMEARELTAQIEVADDAKVAAIGAAAMPVDGLALVDGSVTYEGLPLEVASDAEQLQVSTAIAMAANPRLRVLRLRHGNDLDSASLTRLANLCEAGDYQVWIERVDESGKVGVVIEDGMVAGAAPDPVASGETLL